MYAVNLYIGEDWVKTVYVEADDEYEAEQLVEENPDHQLNYDVEGYDD